MNYLSARMSLVGFLISCCLPLAGFAHDQGINNNPTFQADIMPSGKDLVAPGVVSMSALVGVRTTAQRQHYAVPIYGGYLNHSSVGILDSAASSVPLNIKPSMNLKDFDEIWIEQDESNGSLLCNVQLILNGENRLNAFPKRNMPARIVFSDGELTTVDERLIPIASAPWKPYDFYSKMVGVLYGSGDEGIWRYREKGNGSLLNRRLAVGIDPFTDNIEIRSRTKIVRVNLMVSIGNERPFLVEFTNMPVALSDGSPGVRLPLADRLRSKLIGNVSPGEFVLREVYIYVDQAVGLLVENKGIFDFVIKTSAVAPQGWAPNRQYVHSEFMTEKLGFGRIRRRISLRGLDDWRDFLVSAGSVSIARKIKSLDADCGPSVNAINMVSFYKTNIPIFVSDLTSFYHKFAFSDLLLGPVGLYAVPGLISWFPMSAIDSVAPVNFQRSNLDSEFLDLTLLGSSAKLTVTGKALAAINSGDGLLISASQLFKAKLELAVNQSFITGTQFAFLVQSGAENIIRAKLLVEYSGGRVEGFDVRPNEGLDLGSADGIVKSVKLELYTLKEKPVSFDIMGLGFFRPSSRAISDIFAEEKFIEARSWIPRPSSWQPELISGSGGNIVFQSADNARFSFKTFFLPKVFLPTNLLVKVDGITSPLKNKCIFFFTFKWERGATTLCKGIPLGDLLNIKGSELGPSDDNFGALESIDWIINSSGAKPDTRIKVQYELKGFSFLTAREQLDNMVVFQSSDATLSVEKRMRDGNHDLPFASSFLISFNKEGLGELKDSVIDARASFAVPTNRYFELRDLYTSIGGGEKIAAREKTLDSLVNIAKSWLVTTFLLFLLLVVTLIFAGWRSALWLYDGVRVNTQWMNFPRDNMRRWGIWCSPTMLWRWGPQSLLGGSLLTAAMVATDASLQLSLCFGLAIFMSMLMLRVLSIDSLITERHKFFTFRWYWISFVFAVCVPAGGYLYVKDVESIFRFIPLVIYIYVVLGFELRVVALALSSIVLYRIGLSTDDATEKSCMFLVGAAALFMTFYSATGLLKSIARWSLNVNLVCLDFERPRYFAAAFVALIAAAVGFVSGLHWVAEQLTISAIFGLTAATVLDSFAEARRKRTSH